MKTILLGATALVAFAGSALAADIQARPYTKAPPPVTAPAMVYNWTGFYIGGHLGGSFGGDNALFADNGRFMGGVQGGADYQFAPNWVLGIEAQYSWLANANRTGALGGVLISDRERGLGSVTGRLGYTWGPAMLYAKGGYAFRDNTLSASLAGLPVGLATTGNRDSGYTVGAGLEYMFAPNWSAKAEYQYYNFGNTTLTTATVPTLTANYRNDEHTVKVGLNYRFGWGGPVVARY